MERQKVGGSFNTGKSFKGSKTKPTSTNSQMVGLPKKNIRKERLFNHFHGTNADGSSLDHPQGVEPYDGDALSHNGAQGADLLSTKNRVSFSLDFKSKKELSDLKSKLQSELVLVRNLMKRVEHYGATDLRMDNGVRGGRFKRTHSEAESSDGCRSRLLDLPGENNRGVATAGVGKAMRTPMTAQFPRESDITLGEEKGPMSFQPKESKGSGKRSREESVPISGMENSSSKVFKSCSSLLTKLMKSKGGWWFNEPVDVKGLGLVDYYTVIKNPMDLGTVRSRLLTNRYRSPNEFAEDVRLTFQNAMTYNLEGHEVHNFAKQFLKMFEDRWVSIEADYVGHSSIAADSKEGPAPALAPVQAALAPSRPPSTATPSPPPVVAQPLPPPTDMMMAVDRLEAGNNPAGPEAKSTSFVASGKARLPKPKAKDANKRDMTLEEKQKLSSSLQNLPSEKLEGVLRIIKKRNPSLCQNDDEIEVDIDTVDVETLWELDRFVIYYRKELSKMKRSAELAKIGVVVKPICEENGAYFGTQGAKEHEADENNMFSSSSIEGEQEVGNASVSDGSSSSRSDSGSSSSGSDSDSSSS